MEQLIKTLPAILRAGRYSTEVVEAAAIAAWKNLAGDTVSNQAVATKLNGTVLVVAVADGIWQRQLESMARQLLFRLNSILGQPLVTRLEFCVDPSVQGSSHPARTARKAPEDPLPDSSSLELWSAANAIRDKHLRKLFLRAASRNLQARQDP